MSPVSRKDGLEVWQKKLAGGKLALILFHRNDTGRAAAVVVPPGPPPHTGQAVSMGSCAKNEALAFDLSGR
jgi:hypothetical protein